MLIEKCIAKQRDLYICFIDYVKAFDCVRHDKLISMSNQLEIDGKDLRLKRSVRLHGELGDWISIEKGVLQCCVLSPDLFNLYSKKALREIRSITGLQLGQVNYNYLRYTDDTALIADSEQKLQELLNKVSMDSERLDLTINCQNTFSMVCAKKEQSPKCQVYVNGTQIEQKDSFMYTLCILEVLSPQIVVQTRIFSVEFRWRRRLSWNSSM